MKSGFRFIICLAVFCSLASPESLLFSQRTSAATTDKADPRSDAEEVFTGTFKGTLPGRSDAESEEARQPRILLTTYTKDGDWFSCRAHLISASGVDKEFYSFRAKFDGKEYPFISHPNNTLVLQRLNRLTWMQTERKNGKVIATFTRILSDDGKTMTTLVRHIADDGKETTRVSVHQRQ